MRTAILIIMMKLQRGIAIIFVVMFVLLPVLAGVAAATEPMNLIYPIDPMDPMEPIDPVDPIDLDAARCQTLFQTREMSNHYGYIMINSMDVKLNGANAVYTINHSIDSWIALLVILFGKQDLKNRLLKIINLPATNIDQKQPIVFQCVDPWKTIIFVPNAVMRCGDDAYWYPRQEFAIVIPQITFTGSFVRTYYNTRMIEKGFSY